MADSLNLTQNSNIEVIFPEMLWDEMNDTGEDPLLAALPPTHVKEDMILWEQYENGYGLLSYRGLGGEPDVTAAPGIRRYAVSPGYLGERCRLDEVEMTKSRDPGTPNLPAKPSERISIMMNYQAAKTVNRLCQIIADFLRTGTFTNRSSTGAIVHTDQIENYTAITSMPGAVLPKTGKVLGPSWSADPGNARPLTDLDYTKIELELGTSSQFGPDSTMVSNPLVLADMLNTNQVQQVYKLQYGQTPSSSEDVNKLLQSRGLPKFTPYRRGYFPTIADGVARTNFTRLLPSGGMIWLGTRPKGQKLGKFVLTRNLGVDPPSGASAESPYKASQPTAEGMRWMEGIAVLLEYYPKMPRRYELDIDLNGGPVVHFGSAAAGLTY